MKPGKGKTADKLYSTNSFKYHSLKNLICFIHAFSGCDTTSSFFGKGKNKLTKIMDKFDDLHVYANFFNNENSTPERISEAGCEIVLALYGSTNENVNLSELRYNHFKKGSVKQSFHLQSLPPTVDSAIQHSYRVYFQVQTWLSCQKSALDWGWKATKDGLQPVLTQNTLIPTNLLETISCKCETGCKTQSCSCKKHGLYCNDLCLNCHGQFCCNVDESVSKIAEDMDEDAELSVIVTDEAQEDSDEPFPKKIRV